MSRLPASTALAPDEQRAVAALPLYAGPCFRADSGFWHERGTSAGDVIRFERDELGNADVVVAPIIEAVLDRIRAEMVVWVCADPQDARRYGDGVGEYTFDGEELRVLVADDGDGGMLLWRRPLEETA